MAKIPDINPVRAYLERRVAAALGQAQHSPGLAAFKASILEELEAGGLRLEDYAHLPYLSFTLSQGPAGNWTLVEDAFDEKVGPSRSTTAFDSQDAARRAALERILPNINGFAALRYATGDLIRPPVSPSRWAAWRNWLRSWR